MRSIAASLLGLALLRLAVPAPEAQAAQYPAWGDTGWVYESKRDCCNDAIAIAQQYSGQACMNTGGVPSPFQGGGNRGTCTWQWMQDADGNMMYRCQGEAAVWCR